MLHFNQCCPRRFGLDHPSWLPMQEQQVIDTTVPLLQDKLPDRYAGACSDICLVGILDEPSCRDQLLVDLDSSPGLRGDIVVLHHVPSE